MNLCDLAPEYIRDIAPYQPGKPIAELAREIGLNEASIIKLASNENPLGMSPAALEAIMAALPDLALYPDGSGYALKRAIAKKFDVNMEQIVLGNGSNDVLEFMARTFLRPGLDAIYSQHAFAVYPLVVKAIGARGIEVPAKNFGHDLNAIRAAVTPATRITFIANPNNPTGTYIAASELDSFLRSLPQNILVVLDEAYTEYLPPQNASQSMSWLKEFPNLVISRTFSKAFGLAGLRVGFGVAHADLIAMMNRVRQPFNVNSLALAAAEAALNDGEFVQRSYALNQAGMVQLLAGFRELGLEHIPSFGNFVSIKVGNAAGVYQKLLRAGVIVRPVASYGMPEYLRVTIGLHSQNLTFLAALKQAL
ncbi:MAG: histidinol-phosphate transaminase [Burkholderiales bacterium]